jgi:hypothetical protein
MTPHRSQQLARLLAAGVAAAALTAPAAVARPIDGPNNPVRSDPGTMAAIEPEAARVDAAAHAATIRGIGAALTERACA